MKTVDDISKVTINSKNEKSIYIWEQKERDGKIYYVPLDKNMKPIANVALKDSKEEKNNTYRNNGHFALVSKDIKKQEKKRVNNKQVESLIENIIESILEESDATTYQIYEALINHLTSCEMTSFVEAEDIDVQRILQERFWYYECPISLGTVARIWTMDEKKAKYYMDFDREIAKN